MMNRLRRFMYGRYGTDQLNICLWIAAIVFIIASAIVGRIKTVPGIVGILLSIVSWILVILNIFRSFSKNTAQRRAENYMFLKFANRIKGFFTRLPMFRKDRKTHRYFKCPTCRQTVRVPRGKGKIAIKCPKCGNKFIRRS